MSIEKRLPRHGEEALIGPQAGARWIVDQASARVHGPGSPWIELSERLAKAERDALAEIEAQEALRIEAEMAPEKANPAEWSWKELKRLDAEMLQAVLPPKKSAAHPFAANPELLVAMAHMDQPTPPASFAKDAPDGMDEVGLFPFEGHKMARREVLRGEEADRAQEIFDTLLARCGFEPLRAQTPWPQALLDHLGLSADALDKLLFESENTAFLLLKEKTDEEWGRPALERNALPGGSNARFEPAPPAENRRSLAETARATLRAESGAENDSLEKASRLLADDRWPLFTPMMRLGIAAETRKRMSAMDAALTPTGPTNNSTLGGRVGGGPFLGMPERKERFSSHPHRREASLRRERSLVENRTASPGELSVLRAVYGLAQQEAFHERNALSGRQRAWMLAQWTAKASKACESATGSAVGRAVAMRDQLSPLANGGMSANERLKEAAIAGQKAAVAKQKTMFERENSVSHRTTLVTQMLEKISEKSGLSVSELFVANGAMQAPGIESELASLGARLALPGEIEGRPAIGLAEEGFALRQAAPGKWELWTLASAAFVSDPEKKGGGFWDMKGVLATQETQPDLWAQELYSLSAAGRARLEKVSNMERAFLWAKGRQLRHDADGGKIVSPMSVPNAISIHIARAHDVHADGMNRLSCSFKPPGALLARLNGARIDTVSSQSTEAMARSSVPSAKKAEEKKPAKLTAAHEGLAKINEWIAKANPNDALRDGESLEDYSRRAFALKHLNEVDDAAWRTKTTRIDEKQMNLATEDARAVIADFFEGLGEANAIETHERFAREKSARMTPAGLLWTANGGEQLKQLLAERPGFHRWCAQMAQNLEIMGDGFTLPGRVKAIVEAECGFGPGAWRLVSRLDDKAFEALGAYCDPERHAEVGFALHRDDNAEDRRRKMIGKAKKRASRIGPVISAMVAANAKPEEFLARALAPSPALAAEILDKLGSFLADDMSAREIKGAQMARAYLAECEAREKRLPELARAVGALAKLGSQQEVSEQINDWADYFEKSEIGVWEQMPEKFGAPALTRRAQAWHDLLAEKDGAGDIQRRAKRIEDACAKALGQGDAIHAKSVLENAKKGAWPMALREMAETINGGAWSATALNTGARLFEEGKQMHHCVSSYAEQCAAATHRIYSIKKNGERVSTLCLEPQLDGEGHFTGWKNTQNRGACNATINDADALDFARRVVEAANAASRENLEAQSQARLAAEQAAKEAAEGVAGAVGDQEGPEAETDPLPRENAVGDNGLEIASPPHPGRLDLAARRAQEAAAPATTTRPAFGGR